jgi:DNA (cytosine-5)-methyltransferase 1
MKILNLYAGIGGNRKLWKNEDITAVENNKYIHYIYKDYFPNDKLIIDDAHNYLLENYKNYDFIWSSPPCQSHSSFRFNIGVRYRNVKAIYPDMRLYQEILFLQYYFKGIWIVENVKPYYKPLIEPTFKLGRHYFWSNINIPFKEFKEVRIRNSKIVNYEIQYNYNLDKYNVKNKRQILRNCLNPEIGKYIMEYINETNI